MYQITVESINQFNRVEWQEIVQAKSKAAVSRKANKIVKSIGEEVNINKIQNQYDETLQIWQLV